MLHLHRRGVRGTPTSQRPKERKRRRSCSEPDDVPEVHAATIERIRKGAGEIGEFAQRIVRGDGVLTVAQVWQAWCEHNGEQIQAQEPGGIGKRRLSKALYDHISDPPKPQQISLRGVRLHRIHTLPCDAFPTTRCAKLPKLPAFPCLTTDDNVPLSDLFSFLRLMAPSIQGGPPWPPGSSSPLLITGLPVAELDV